MPSRNAIKLYAPKRFYHIYNRGLNKSLIFNDDLDYRIFLDYLKVALLPLSEIQKSELAVELMNRKLRRHHYPDEIELLAYCLMPNHFHLFVYQHTAHAIRDLMRSIMGGYVQYFNKRHKRIGPLFQGRYKASIITEEKYLWHVSRYIHLNPMDIGQDFHAYNYSSLAYYMGFKNSKWVKPKRILELHNNSQTNYQKFLLDYEDYHQTLNEIKKELAG